MSVLYSSTNGMFGDALRSAISNKSTRCLSATLSSTRITIY